MEVVGVVEVAAAVVVAAVVVVAVAVDPGDAETSESPFEGPFHEDLT